eukprot:2392565-Rhodomonas_salina.1
MAQFAGVLAPSPLPPPPPAARRLSVALTCSVGGEVGRVVCDLAATSIMGGARWAFWVLELILLVRPASPPPLAAPRRGTDAG